MMEKSAIIIGIFSVLLMSFGMVSAYSSTQDGVNVQTLTELPNPVVPGTNYNVTIRVTNTYGSNISLSWADTSATSGITVNVSSGDELENDTSSDYNITYIIPSSFEGTDIKHQVDLTVINLTSDVVANFHPYSPATYTATPAPTPETACEFEFNESENGTLKIAGFDISSTGDEEEWAPLDELSIEVEIENKDKHDDVRDVEVRMIVLNDTGYDVTDDFDFNDDVITSINRLNNDDSEYVTFDLKVPSDIEYGEYKLYVVAYSDGKIDEQCVSKYNDNDFTDDLYYSFSVEEVQYEDSIIIDETKLGTVMEVFCGQNNVEIPVSVFNLNDDDEPMILVELYNSELGIDENKTIEDLNDRHDETPVFHIDVPKNLEKDRYDLRIKTYFDWDDNEDEYKTSSYNEENTYYLALDVAGCAGPAPSIDPSLESEIKEGSELVVSALITNNGNDADFEISVSGYESWADLVSITPQNAVVSEGKSVEAIIVLMPNKDGRQSFTISATVDDETYDQPISVNVKNTLGLEDLADNKLALAGLIAIGVVLVFIILTLIVKTSRRRPVKPQF